MRMSRSMVAALVATALFGCGDDRLRQAICYSNESAFDIGQVSALELLYSVTDGIYRTTPGADGVILTADRSKVPEGGKWKVGTVDVLVAILDSEWSSYGADQELEVQVWDGTDPGASAPWTVRQTLDPAALQWERGSFAVDDGFGSTTTKGGRRAWWTFDFTKVIPDDAMTSSRYFVGVRWVQPERPLLGGSEFNRDCVVNWSDRGQGWVPNEGVGNQCNWPMFRVGAQIITTQPTCD